jgi:hypothetical protein
MKQDVGHTSLVQIIKAAYQFFDESSFILLRMTGQEIGESVAKIEDVDGSVEEVEDGIYALPKCPFAESIAAYKESYGALPEDLYDLAGYANKRGEAWISAFCGIHQTCRQAVIGDAYKQIACRSGERVKVVEQDLLSDERIEEILASNVCIYAITGELS